VRLLVSESVSAAADGAFEFRKLAETPIRGSMDRVRVYTTAAQQ